MEEIIDLSKKLEILIKRHIFDSGNYFVQKLLSDLYFSSSNFNQLMEKQNGIEKI